MTQPPICLNVSLHLDETYGGIAASMPRFCDSVSQTGRFTSHLAAWCDEGESQSNPLRYGMVHQFPRGRVKWAMDGKLRQRFADLIRAAAVVHIHGLWCEYSAITSKLCRTMGKPYIVSAHGMLEPWALANGKWRKSIYLAAVERAVLRGAAGLRALTRDEVENYRAVGLANRAVVVPNGIDLPEAVGPELFLDARPNLRGKRIVLFLGRIHPKKGIDLLCRAWAALEKTFPDVHVVVAGPDEGGTLPRLVELSRQLGIEDRITFPGMLRGAMKWSALAASSLFVLPSHSEGFSIAILESLAAGVPALVSSNCHFPELAERGCGWEIAADEHQLRRSLDEILRLPAESLLKAGHLGRKLVQERYTWSAVGSATADMLEESCVVERGAVAV